MKSRSTLPIALALACAVFAAAPGQPASSPGNHENERNENMDPLHFGNFSVSLAVKDLQASRTFYEKMDFKQVGGDQAQNWLIMQNGTTTIGLFQGMFEANLMTFNPGWDHEHNTPDSFQDVRDLQATLIERGLKPVAEADPTSTGPASFVLVDPDGNSILVDQHVPKPE